MQGELVAALKADGLLGALVGDGVFDAPPKGRAPPYVVIGLVVLAFALAAAVVRFPAGERAEDGAGLSGLSAAFRRPRLVAAAAAQLLYVGAQVGIWSFTIRYAQANVPGMSERAGADALFVSLLLFAAGRVVGSSLMSQARSAMLLAAFAGAACVLTLVAALSPGQAGLYALVAASFFLSIQFPTIFALGVEGLGPLRRAGASLIIMAIIGGAVLTALMGWVSDKAGIATAMLVPAASFVCIVAFALYARRPVAQD